jgi:hypothetical protein
VDNGNAKVVSEILTETTAFVRLAAVLDCRSFFIFVRAIPAYGKKNRFLFLAVSTPNGIAPSMKSRLGQNEVKKFRNAGVADFVL